MSNLFEHLTQKCLEWQEDLDSMRRTARSAWQPEKDFMHAEADGFENMLIMLRKVLREYRTEETQ